MQHGDAKVPYPECGRSIHKDDLRDHQTTTICRANRNVGYTHNTQVSNSSQSQDAVQIGDAVHIGDVANAKSAVQFEDAMQSENAMRAGNTTQVGAMSNGLIQSGSLDSTPDMWLDGSIEIALGLLHELPQLVSGEPLRSTREVQSKPEIVPDSPRPVAPDGALGMLFLDDGQSIGRSNLDEKHLSTPELLRTNSIRARCQRVLNFFKLEDRRVGFRRCHLAQIVSFAQRA